MIRRFLVVLTIFIFAFGILFTSIARTATIRRSFSLSSTSLSDVKVLGETTLIDYKLPYPGKVLPDHPLWPIKVIRDRLWLFVTTNPTRKIELNILFADKRLVSAEMLFEKDKPDIAYSTLTKAEKYLENASLLEETKRKMGEDTTGVLEQLAKSSLKHREIMEEILLIAPEDARPEIIKLEDYSTSAYSRARDALYEKGLTPPENPFGSQ